MDTGPFCRTVDNIWAECYIDICDISPTCEGIEVKIFYCSETVMGLRLPTVKITHRSDLQ